MIAKILVGLVLAGIVYLWIRRKFVAAAAPSVRPGEARQLLGVAESATADEIRAAHRRLIAKVHPDAGGSQGLATRVNAARDALIEELKRK